MADSQSGIFIFPKEFFSKPKNEGNKKIQENPAVAVAESQSRLFSRNLITGAAMLAVLLLVAVVRINDLKQSQYVDVQADFNYESALYGKVTSVNSDYHEFAVDLDSDRASEINHQPVSYLVKLPPGSDFQNTDKLPICYTVNDINLDLTRGQIVACSEIIKPGRTLLIENISIDENALIMIAKKIIGSAR